MKMIIAMDDLIFARTGQEVRADKKHLNEKITWKGIEFQVDMSEQTFNEVDKFLMELAEAGVITSGRPRKYASYGTSGNISRGGAENTKMRAWCKAQGIMAKDGPKRLAYLTPGKGKSGPKYYNPAWLWELYDAAMEEKRGLGGDRSPEQHADDGDRGEQG